MLASLHPIFYIAFLLSIVWWFYSVYSKKSRAVPNLTFWSSSIMYAVSMYFSDFSLYQKLLGMLAPEAGAAILVFLIANNLKHTRAFFLTAMGVGLGGYLIYSGLVQEGVLYVKNKFTTSTPANKNKQNTKLDSNAELLFDIKSDALLDKIKKALKAYNLKIEKAFPNLKNGEGTELDDFYAVDVPNDQLANLETIVNKLNATGAVDAIEYNEVYSLSPLELKQTSTTSSKGDYLVNDPDIDKLWGFDKMQVADLYKYMKENKIKPKKKVKIFILDTGVDAEHEDLKGKYKSVSSKYDYDKQSHGTHCAGIAASVSNNKIGIASLTPNNDFVTVTSVKVLTDQGWGTDKMIVNGIIEAADNGADVISMSLGGPSRDNKQRAYKQAVQYANRAGAIVVVAAGNESQNATKVTPANVEGVITVSAIAQNMDMASFSNWVSDLKMGIAAPGVDILSTVPGNKYASYSGTSMATPYVAGLLGLMRSINPQIKTKEAYQILRNTGIDTKQTEKTGKFIQPLAVLKAIQK
ncbi:S8 family serine peptidase [uncultured Microscilla sp.]|uniref:S8 family peptidase n=1 Tax=uncultured Microscilla sp. TaxID=432653 RepID=UPI0026033EB3|nr:S8 family serine peptidase [uncultured Microscilla sp.]